MERQATSKPHAKGGKVLVNFTAHPTLKGRVCEGTRSQSPGKNEYTVYLTVCPDEADKGVKLIFIAPSVVLYDSELSHCQHGRIIKRHWVGAACTLCVYWHHYLRVG